MTRPSDETLLQHVEEGLSYRDIAPLYGVSLSTVQRWMQDLPHARKRNKMPSAITFPVKPEHRQDYAYKALANLDVEFEGGALSPAQRRDVERFRRGLKKKIWIYDQHGFRKVPRLPEDGDAMVRPPDGIERGS